MGVIFLRERVSSIHLVTREGDPLGLNGSLLFLSPCNTFKVYFAPDIEKAIDLRDFQSKQQDNYPYKIRDKMRYDEDYKDLEYYQKYQKDNAANFKTYSIEKNANSIFLKFVFIKDQYGRYHFISSYMDKFSLTQRNFLAVRSTRPPSALRVILSQLSPPLEPVCAGVMS